MTVIKNLTVYGNQPIDSVMGSSARLVQAINDGLIEKHKVKRGRNA